MMALCGAYGAIDRMTGGLFAAQTAPLQRRKAAKSIIEIWVWGGPSHLETFDPKPNAGKAYNGDFGDIATNVPGIRISEFLPKLAQQADKYSIIRSMNHHTNGHETATYLMQTGRMPGDGITYPAIGAVIAMLKSSTYKGKLPPYIALTSNKGRFSENGFLSDRFKPLATGSNPNAAKFLVDGFVAPGGISDDHLKKRNLYAEMLDKLIENFGDVPVLPMLTTLSTSEHFPNARVEARNEIVRKLAAERGLTVIDLYAVACANREHIADGVHFNGEGYNALADELLRIVDEICP